MGLSLMNLLGLLSSVHFTHNWLCHQSQSYVTTNGQSASLSWCQAPFWGLRPDFYFCHTILFLLMWGTLPDERMGLLFTIAAGPCQHSHSRVQVPWDSWPYFIGSGSGLPQHGEPDPCIYIPPPIQGGPVIPPGIGFPFCCLLRLAGVRWWYLTPPPHGLTRDCVAPTVFKITSRHGLHGKHSIFHCCSTTVAAA
jgi:hypothetical protein